MEKTVFVCCNIVIGYPRHTLQYCTVSSYRGSVLYTHKTSTIYGSFLPRRLLRCEALRHIIRTLYYDNIYVLLYYYPRDSSRGNKSRMEEHNFHDNTDARCKYVHGAGNGSRNVRTPPACTHSSCLAEHLHESV